MMGSKDFKIKIPDHPQFSPPKYPHGQVYTAEGIGNLFGFEDQLTEWLRNREFNPDDPLIVLEYLPTFTHVNLGCFNGNKQVIIDALTRNHAQQMDHDGKVFFFQDHGAMYLAHKEMRFNPNTSWAFHPVHHEEVYLLSQLEDDLYYQPKILTTGIASSAENQFAVFNYQFFQHQ